MNVSIDRYRHAALRAAAWLRTMLVAPDGSAGVYERYRINLQAINPWVRPDCCIEVALFFHALGDMERDPEFTTIAIRLADYVLSLQRREAGWLEGSFPFYVFRPLMPGQRDIGDDFGIPDLPGRAWPNDNGKIAACLLRFYEQTGEGRYLDAARRASDYLLRTQADDGAFSLTESGDDPGFKGADFVARPAHALAEAARHTGERRYVEGLLRGLRWLNEHRDTSGRMLTSYETAHTEAWRPPSSETAIALLTLARAAPVVAEPWVGEAVEGLGTALLRWAHASGAIRNCDAGSASASLQNNPDVTDLIYTDGYALHALGEAYAVTREARFREAQRRLADFLVAVQCRGESAAWDGSWRGSYHLERGAWFGTADQENPLDEGGMNTAYTGWSAAPIAHGLVQLCSAERSGP